MDRFRGAGRLVAIVAAVVLAGVAAAALFTYVRGIEQRAFEGAELVEVFVANEDIPAGLSGAAASEAGLIVRDTQPRDSVPSGAIGSLDQIAGSVTASPILTGEVIVLGRFDDSDEVVTTLEIPDGFEAMTVQVGIPQGVAGFVRPGDRVSLIATLAAGTQPDDDDDADLDASIQRSQYVLQDIEVLSTGQRVGDGADGVEEGSGQVLLTVALAPEDAERLVFAISQASLYFTLLPEDADPPATPGTTLDDLFD